jgi:hypothetical protein
MPQLRYQDYRKTNKQECLSHPTNFAKLRQGCCQNLHRHDCLCHLLDGLGLGNVSEEIEDAALELGGLEAESGGVECAGDFPDLFGADCGGVDALRVAAGEGFVFFVAD